MPGEVHALIGENGAGKSTMIKIMAGIEKPDFGSEIYFEGKQIYHMTPSKSTSLGISVIYQDISLFPNLTVAENISMGLSKDLMFNKKTMLDRANNALKSVGVNINIETKLGDLSIGQQQLVAIVRSVTQNSKMIIMDEPTSALSSTEIDLLFELIKKLVNLNIGIIYISHKLDEVFKIANKVSVLRDGNLVACDSIEKFSNESLIRNMVGRELRFVPMKNTSGFGEIIFEVKNLKNDFLNNISFNLREGEILGITGLVGSGRSELAQTIFGLNKLENGEILLKERKLHIKNTSDAINKGISYLPEDRLVQGLFRGQTMTWNITSATIDRVLNKFKLISEIKELEVTNKFINALDIRPNNPLILIESMSGGNQQKALIGRWLNTEPKLLIADEPTSGVDVGAKLEIHRLLRKLAENGVAVILISSDLLEVLAISDTILVMRGGRIVGEFDSNNVTQEDILFKGLMG